MQGASPRPREGQQWKELPAQTSPAPTRRQIPGSLPKFRVEAVSLVSIPLEFRVITKPGVLSEENPRRAAAQLSGSGDVLNEQEETNRLFLR